MSGAFEHKILSATLLEILNWNKTGSRTVQGSLILVKLIIVLTEMVNLGGCPMAVL